MWMRSVGCAWEPLRARVVGAVPREGTSMERVAIARRQSRGGAFTLVELLIVIGIIAVLIGILLPVVGRARQQANAIACASNLRQVAMAFMMYTQGNKGVFPTAGQLSNNNPAFQWRQLPTDWLYWGADMQFAPYGFTAAQYNIDGSPIARYLAKPLRARVLQCPSDELNRTRNTGYFYSYVGNCRIGSMSGKDDERAWKFNQIKHSQEKMLLFEEDEVTIDDTYGTPDFAVNRGLTTNLLAIRHDIRRGQREPTPAANMYNTLPNPTRRGNVAFCDGSVRYMSRKEFHTPNVCCPRWPEVKVSVFALYGPT
jgi:prepilin-type processing-associated H-X9-DG protein